jgi:hypothetical protein
MPADSRPGGRNVGLMTGLSVGVSSLLGVGLSAATGRWGLWMGLCIGLGAIVAFLFRGSSSQI